MPATGADGALDHTIPWPTGAGGGGAAGAEAAGAGEAAGADAVDGALTSVEGCEPAGGGAEGDDQTMPCPLALELGLLGAAQALRANEERMRRASLVRMVLDHRKSEPLAQGPEPATIPFSPARSDGTPASAGRRACPP